MSLGAEPLKREPLRPFSEIENMLFQGSLIIAAVVGGWFLFMLVRDALRDRRADKERKDPPSK